MRAIVIALAVLAALKIWVHHSLYRSASEQALLNAYLHQAVGACDRSTQKGGRAHKVAGQRRGWSEFRSAKVVIGDSALPVSLWQIDHKLWDQKFKTPFIHLQASNAPRPDICIFNVMTGLALVSNA